VRATLRVTAALLLAWAAGFLWFIASLRPPAPGTEATDGIVVLTGGSGRVARGVDLIRRGKAKRLLISGVAAGVRPEEIAGMIDAPPGIFRCCIDLGFEALNTRGNASEVADWVQRNGFSSIRLVTSAYHLPRATLEIRERLGQDFTVVGDPVPGKPLPVDLAREYSKFIFRATLIRLGID
jgi:uncharacterized SAM-binding protein YcdF (DUF218 family)